MFRTFKNVDHALFQKIMGAIKDNFLRVLHIPHLGYSIFSTLALLTHLSATYSVITNTDWLANYNRFREVYAPLNPLKFSGGRSMMQSRMVNPDLRHTP